MATPKWPKAMMKSECQPSFLIEGYVLCLHFGLAFVCLTVRCTTDQSSSMHNWPRISRGGKARKYWNNHSPLLCCCRSLLFCLLLLVPADAILSLLLLSWWKTWCYMVVYNTGSFSFSARPCTTRISWPDMVRARALNFRLLRTQVSWLHSKERNAIQDSLTALKLLCTLSISFHSSLLLVLCRARLSS